MTFSKVQISLYINLDSLTGYRCEGGQVRQVCGRVILPGSITGKGQGCIITLTRSIMLQTSKFISEKLFIVFCVNMTSEFLYFHPQ